MSKKLFWEEQQLLQNPYLYIASLIISFMTKGSRTFPQLCLPQRTEQKHTYSCGFDPAWSAPAIWGIFRVTYARSEYQKWRVQGHNTRGRSSNPSLLESGNRCWPNPPAKARWNQTQNKLSVQTVRNLEGVSQSSYYTPGSSSWKGEARATDRNDDLILSAYKNARLCERCQRLQRRFCAWTRRWREPEKDSRYHGQFNLSCPSERTHYKRMATALKQ